jgi:hypothetical protein
MIDGEGKTREEWDDDTTLPLCALTMCSNDAMDNRITDLVLNGHILNSRSTFSIRTKSQACVKERNDAYDVMKNWFSM